MVGEVKAVVRRFLPSADVLLYGSAARGERGPDSDYDFLVLTDGPLSRAQEDEIDDAVYDVQLRNAALIVTSFRTKEAWRAHPSIPFRQQVEKDAVLL